MGRMVAEVTGFQGRIETEPSKPDGTMRKLMEVSRWPIWVGARASGCGRGSRGRMSGMQKTNLKQSIGLPRRSEEVT